MNIRPQLQNFTDDITQQQQALSDVRHTMQHWKNSEIGKSQRAYILNAGDASTAQDCIAHLKPLFDDISWLYQMIATLCDVQSKNPFANIELRSSKSEKLSSIILHQERKFSINITILKSRDQSGKMAQDSFIFGPNMMMITPIGHAQIIKAQLDENDKLIGRETLTCDNRETYIYDNRRQSIRFITQNNDVIFLRAIIKTGAFDDSADNISHHYLQFNSDNKPQRQLADDTLVRAQLMFSILRHQNNKKAISLFEEWVRSDVPDMRWYVMREFLALDIEAALPHLICMSEDDDNHRIRKAAVDTLQILKAQYPLAFPYTHPL